MKNITKSVRYALIAAATLVAAGAFTAASKPDFALGRNIQILFNMFRDVSAFYVDSVDTDEMLRDAAAGMTSNLDPYTVLIPEDEMEEFEILTTGKYGGIGALVRQSGDWIAIAQPYEGFPADKAGLVIGDKLLEVDGRSIRGLARCSRVRPAPRCGSRSRSCSPESRPTSRYGASASRYRAFPITA